jgi:hypothetical protein
MSCPGHYSPADLYKYVNENLKTLVKADSSGIAGLMLEFWPKEQYKIVRKLQDAPDLQLSYLKGIFGQNELPEDLKQVPCPQKWILLCNLYFDLLCSLEPHHVKSELERICDSFESYPFTMTSIIASCKQFHVTDASIWLLEKMGDVTGAFKVLLDALSVQTDKFDRLRLLKDGFSFCERTSKMTDLGASEKNEFWFSLFDKINQSSRDPLGKGKEDIKLVLDAMIGYVPLSLILLHIVQKQSKASFGEYKSMIDSMLTVNNYEKELYSTTTEMVTSEVFANFQKLVQSKQRAIRPLKGHCRLCQKMIHIHAMSFEDRNKEVVVLACRHAFHYDCFQLVGSQCHECKVSFD